MKIWLKGSVIAALMCCAVGVLAAEGGLSGRDLFTGKSTFKNGGPPCIACHSRSDVKVLGGKLGPSLDDAGDNFSADELVDFLGGDDSPVMYATYNSRPLTEEEKEAVAQYLITPVQQKENKGNFTAALIAGAVFFLITAAARKMFFV